MLTFEPFKDLPPKSLKDYYQIIPNPTSIRQIQLLVRGKQPRGPSTGISPFKSWKSFEDDVSLIWKNAWHYNEDGSEISLLATELKV
jgi:hypothetical protein